MENEKKLQLSDIRRPGANVPVLDAITQASSMNRNKGIIDNTIVEDTIASNPELLQNSSINQRLSMLNDKKNELSTINNQIERVDRSIATEVQGRGITQLGQRPRQVIEVRRLEDEADRVAADVEFLRGNIENAQRIATSSRSRSGGSSSSDSSLIPGVNDPSFASDVSGDKGQLISALRTLTNASGMFIEGVTDLTNDELNAMSPEQIRELAIKAQNEIQSGSGGNSAIRDVFNSVVSGGSEINRNTNRATGSTIFDVLTSTNQATAGLNLLQRLF